MSSGIIGITFQCSDCGNTFKSLQALTEHMESQCVTIATQNNEVEELLSKLPGIRVVKKAEKKQKTTPKKSKIENNESVRCFFVCPTCPEIFASEEILDKHQPTCGTPKESLSKKKQKSSFEPYTFDRLAHTYSCNKCPVEFEFKSLIEDHVKSAHAYFHCDVCDIEFDSPLKFGYHSLKHAPDMLMSCPWCSFRTPLKTELKNHLQTEHPDEEMNLPHVEDSDYPCVVCGKQFFDCRKLLHHQKNVHKANVICVPLLGAKLPESTEVAPKEPCSLLCDTCGKNFSSKYRLERHQRAMHEGLKPFVCNYCGRAFTGKDTLKKHERIHTGEKPYHCEYCGKNFRQPGPFSVHRRTHTGERPYQCKFCNRRFITNQIKKMHMKNCTIRAGKFAPDSTTVEFYQEVREVKDAALIGATIEMAESGEPAVIGGFLPDEYCFEIKIEPPDTPPRRKTRSTNKNKYFKSEESDDELPLLSRLKNLAEKPQKKLKGKQRRCPRCQETFDTAAEWQRHKWSEDCSFRPPQSPPPAVKRRKPHSNRIHACKYCQEIFKTLKLLKEHKKVHKPEEMCEEEEPFYKLDHIQDLYICSVCSAEYQEEDEAKEHILTHRQIIKCIACNMEFKEYFDLGVHNKQTHDQEGKFGCPLCTYASSNLYSFKAHINYVHLKRFPFYCKECGKGFKHYKTYMEHQNLHIGKKPYVCIVCEKAFTYEKYLHVHQVRNHQVGITGRKIENECRTCNRHFYKAQALEEHIEICYKRQKKPKSAIPVKAFLCDTCGQTFTEKAKLLEHLRVHRGDLPFVCTWCGKKFPVKSYLKTHERVHTGEKPYSCEFCGKRFAQHAPFRVHRRTHTGERPYVCEFCNKGFTTNQGLKLHKKNCSGGLKKAKIEQLPQQQYVQLNPTYIMDDHGIFGRFTKHTLTPCTKTTWTCKYCQEKFEDRHLLRLHKTSHKATYFEEERPSYKYDEVQSIYFCETCSAEYQKVEEVEEHLKIHQRLFKCSNCSQEFESPFEFGMHQMKHSEAKTLKCPCCPYISKTLNPNSFKAHVNYQHLKRFPFFCKECGKGFKQFKVYQEHQNLHQGTKPYSCIVCSKTFTFEKYMVVHQLKKHQASVSVKDYDMPQIISHRIKKQPNSFLCDTCGQGFTEKSKLLKHIRVHKGDLPFVCQWCDKRFPQKDYLKTHERVHTREKPYSCEFCGKCFGFSASFKVHIRTHTGERPYVCSFCSKGFTTNQGLKLHKKNCPGISMLKIEKTL
ncbi:zinc finger protein 721-like [Anthonomus grandis grandis]|uniref:zinc finger protein 721-like n=1 Tax=Anthonomus grandis grandis TaxID=2921223 RepID=UPI002166AE95|nr:zinc finger protein 721-like [Anthonomus grandis grandis]